MKISVLTIFPDFFGAALAEGMIRAARDRGVLEIGIVGLRDFTSDAHRTTDDYPFGGGVGMIMKVEPIDRALRAIGVGERDARRAGERVTLLSPQGRASTRREPSSSRVSSTSCSCAGATRGVDERVHEHLVDDELSIGDFVLSGGEAAALCIIDAVARLLPGVVGDFDSVESDSFHSGLLDCAYYTRPAEYQGLRVPEVLLSGNHAHIARHRRQESLRRTFERRPDLLESADLSREDRAYLESLRRR
jgi:tRNA (guanine37-N1)-methyltransferase